MQEDMIAAMATPPGESGVGIVRLSGQGCIDLIDGVFVPVYTRSLQKTRGFRMRLGQIKDGDNVLDEVLVLVFRHPHSYTGEDVVEIHCHGGAIVMQRLLELVLQLGARLADPGEFTKRAFLHGRIDLSQAEAVIDIIRAKTDSSLGVAVDQLEGSLSKRISQVRSMLYDIVVRVEASIDFPEDDIPEVENKQIGWVIDQVVEDVTKLVATADEGRILRDGVKTVITGKPNVGKSSLLNRLVDENRALVTDIPGTTRDVIEEWLNVRGIPIRLLDTAGIRKTRDQIEKLGVEKAVALLQQADLILHVLDRSEPLNDDDLQILQKTSGKRRILVINKTDLPPAWSKTELNMGEDTPVVEISLLDGPLDPLVQAIVGSLMSRVEAMGASAFVTRTRHKRCLEKTLDDLALAKETMEQGLPLDLIAIGLQGAIEHLGEITGETVRENVIEQIFAQFCIGK